MLEGETNFGSSKILIKSIQTPLSPNSPRSNFSHRDLFDLGNAKSTAPHISLLSLLSTIVKIGEFAEFFDTAVTDMSAGYVGLPSFRIGLPNGCCSLDTIEIFKFFHSSTELTEADYNDFIEE